MSIEPMLVLSTSHLPKLQMDDLARLSREEVHVTRSIPHEYGVIIFVSETVYSARTKELQAVTDYAQKIGCSWINFDRDADTIDGLPTWEW